MTGVGHTSRQLVLTERSMPTGRAVRADGYPTERSMPAGRADDVPTGRSMLAGRADEFPTEGVDVGRQADDISERLPSSDDICC
jgi:hypothetical protein